MVAAHEHRTHVFLLHVRRSRRRAPISGGCSPGFRGCWPRSRPGPRSCSARAGAVIRGRRRPGRGWGIGRRPRPRSGPRRCSRCPTRWVRWRTGPSGSGMPDVLARQANRLSGAEKKAFEAESDQLVADAVAAGLSVAAFEQRCRQLVDRLMGDDGMGELEKQRRTSRARAWVDDDTGMTNVRGEWDPVRGEAVSRALKAEIAARVAAGAKNITPRQQAQLAAVALHAPVRPGSFPSSSAATASPSTSAENAAWPPAPNARRYGPAIRPAAWTKAATSPSMTASHHIRPWKARRPHQPRPQCPGCDMRFGSALP